MKNVFKKISTSALLSQILAATVVYYLLLSDNCIHCSISYLVRYSHTLTVKKHLLLLGMLPIYIGLIVFGTSLIFASLNTKLQRLLSSNHKGKKVQNITLDAKFEPEV